MNESVMWKNEKSPSPTRLKKTFSSSKSRRNSSVKCATRTACEVRWNVPPTNATT